MMPTLLIIGGTGFVSGTLRVLAQEQGWDVTVLTRGARQVPETTRSLIADRNDHTAFRRLIEEQNIIWDMVVDCIAYKKEHIEQDLDCFPLRAKHLVFISTDFVIQQEARTFPQVECAEFLGSCEYGAQKAQCEKTLEGADTGPMRWTILRPPHIYGPGSQLGCLPYHARDKELLSRICKEDTLNLISGGIFLQQPVFARDLAQTILSVYGNAKAHRQKYFVAGPEAVESLAYYKIIGDTLGKKIRICEKSLAEARKNHPEFKPYLCHRVYSRDKLREHGLALPDTPLADGLKMHIRALEKHFLNITL